MEACLYGQVAVALTYCSEIRCLQVKSVRCSLRGMQRQQEHSQRTLLFMGAQQ